MQYNVSFGSAFVADQFGFVRKGTVTTGGDAVVFSGKQRWSTMAKFGVFLAITILPAILFGFGLGWLLALIVIHEFCTSDGSLSIQKSTIAELQRDGRRIKFTGQQPDSGETKKTVLKVDSEENAKRLENELTA